MTKSTTQMSDSTQTIVSDIKDLIADIVDYHNHLKQWQAITLWTSNHWTTGRCSFVGLRVYKSIATSLNPIQLVIHSVNHLSAVFTRTCRRFITVTHSSEIVCDINIYAVKASMVVCINVAFCVEKFLKFNIISSLFCVLLRCMYMQVVLIKFKKTVDVLSV